MCTKPALRIMADQFGNDQNTVTLLRLYIPGDVLQYRIPVCNPIRTQ